MERPKILVYTEINSYIIGMLLGIVFALTTLMLFQNNRFVDTDELDDKLNKVIAFMDSAVDVVNGEYHDYINYRMLNLNDIERDTLVTTGYYNHTGFYCVQTYGYSKDDVKDTEAHEQIHAYIIQNVTCGSGDETCPQHFCDDYCEVK